MNAPLQFFYLSVFAAAVLVACEPNNARQSDKDPIIGKYDWLVNGSSHRGTTHIAYEGYIIDVYQSENPRSAGARVAGFWKVLDKEKRQYLLHWKDPWNEFKDTLVLSEDGNYLKGTNNIGSVIEGKRVLQSEAHSAAPAPEEHVAVYPTEEARDAAFARYRENRAKKDLDIIAAQLGTFRTDNGFFPTTEQGVAALVEKPRSSPEPKQWRQLLARLPQDPWGEPYVYRSTGDNFFIASTGPDRTEGGEDDIRFDAKN